VPHRLDGLRRPDVFISTQKQTALIRWLGTAAGFIIIAGVLLFKSPEFSSPFNTTIGYTAFAFLYASVLYYVIHNPYSTGGSLLKNSILRFIGKISFGLYVFLYSRDCYLRPEN
jgi:peptidoglycan/LPS O-acetylase OafA/YrhL